MSGKDEYLEEPVEIKLEDEDDECMFLGSRPVPKMGDKPLLELTNKTRFKRKNASYATKKPRTKSLRPQGRPKKYLFENNESESDFELSDLEPNFDNIAIAQRAVRDQSQSARQTTRWVVYTDIDEKMLSHWMVQGRSLDYIVKAYRNMRSPNGLYQKMAGLRRQYNGVEWSVDKESHFDSTAVGLTQKGPIPRDDLLQFKLRLLEMSSHPQIKARNSGQ